MKATEAISASTVGESSAFILTSDRCSAPQAARPEERLLRRRLDCPSSAAIVHLLHFSCQRKEDNEAVNFRGKGMVLYQTTIRSARFRLADALEWSPVWKNPESYISARLR